MKEQQEKIRVLDPHIILILFISAFVFGIGMLMIFLERKEIRTEGYEFIIFSVEILMLLLILYYMRTVVLSREGCTVSWLFWKRNYKWEELAVIREDVWYTYGKGGIIRYQGIVFSKYAVNKKKKKYTTRMIVDAFPLPLLQERHTADIWMQLHTCRIPEPSLYQSGFSVLPPFVSW